MSHYCNAPTKYKRWNSDELVLCSNQVREGRDHCQWHDGSPSKRDQLVDVLVEALTAIAKQPPHTLACREMAQEALQKAGAKP